MLPKIPRALRTPGIAIALGHVQLDAAAPLNVPAVVEGALLQRQEALDAVVEVAALVRMRKEVRHVRQALVAGKLVQLQWRCD